MTYIYERIDEKEKFLREIVWIPWVPLVLLGIIVWLLGDEGVEVVVVIGMVIFLLQFFFWLWYCELKHKFWRDYEALSEEAKQGVERELSKKSAQGSDYIYTKAALISLGKLAVIQYSRITKVYYKPGPKGTTHTVIECGDDRYVLLGRLNL